MVLAIEFPTSQPFRLLNLPREVRDNIYHAMLCDWREDPLRSHILVNEMNPSALGVPLHMYAKVRFAPMRHNIEPNILLANKQIHQEAKEVLLKGNLFVHVSMAVRDTDTLPTIFVHTKMPVVATGLRCPAVFKDLVVMTHSIDLAKTPGASRERIEALDVIILHRDLARFCGCIDLHDIRYGTSSSRSKHQVTIHNPFANTSSPSFLSRKNQGRLLEPYPKSLQGFEPFNIGGHVESDLAESVVARIKEEPPLPDPGAFVRDLRRQEELGNQSFRDGDREKARQLWKQAETVLDRTMNRRSWLRLKQAGGEDFVDQVAQLAFELESDRGEYLLSAMQGLPLQIQISQGRSYYGNVQEADKPSHLQRRLKSLLKDLLASCSQAQLNGQYLSRNWDPSDEQLARNHYRQAQGLRLVGEVQPMLDPHHAEELINRAVELLPDDPLIQSEAQQIRVWKARVQGV